MNLFIETLNDFANGLLPVAWQMFWQSGLLIVVIFAVDFLLRRKLRASVRYALWLVVLVKLLLPPTLALPTGLAWWLRPGEAPAAVVQAKEVVVTYPDNVIPFHRPIISATFVPPAPHLSVQAWIFNFALVVSAGLFAWSLTRWIQISRTVRQAGEPSDSIAAVSEEARAIIHLNSPVVARITKEKMSPAVCGLFRPVILLPESLVKNLSASQLRAVLIHELVHLKRGDVWVNCVQALVQIIYWWHPFVWFANARIRRVREEAVDDAVMLALREDSNSYAPTLLQVAKLAFHRPLTSLGLVGILESRSALRQRVERLIDFKMPRKTGISLVSFLGIAAFTALAVPMGEAPPRPLTQSKASSGLMASPNELRTRFTAPEPASVAGILTDPQFKTVIKALQQHDNLDDFINGTAATFPVASVNNFRITWLELKANGIETRPVVETGEKPEHNFRPIQLAQNSIGLGTQPLQATAPISPLDGVLAFDKELKEATVNAGEAEAKFKFNLTNVSSFAVTITDILTSCGCTVAKMPTSPWLLAPGATSEIPVTMNLAGKSGVLTKTVSVNSDKGTKVLTVKATINPAQETGPAMIAQPSPGRQAIMQKLDQIHLNGVLYEGLPLAEVIHDLNEKVKKRDPDHRGINFLIKPGATSQATPANDVAWGVPIAAFTATNEAVDINSVLINLNRLTDVRLADLLDIIVKSSDRPVKYSILDYGIVFSPLTQADLLHLRRFKVDPNTFMQAIERETGISFPRAPQTTAVPTIPRVAVNGNSFVAGTVRTNSMSGIQSALNAFFRPRGVNLEPPKHVFYGDLRGDLMVYATEEDLDIIEQAIQSLNTTPPQVNIRVKFIEMPTELAEALPFGWTNLSVGAPRVISLLTSPQVRELIPALQNKNGVAELSDGQITTLSGRQVQFQVADLQMEAAMKLLNTNHPTLTNTLPTGPTLDVVPSVAADGYTIEMALIPTLPEFLGYDDPGQFVIQDHGTNGPLTTVLPLPHFRLRQVTTSVVVWDGQTAVLGGLIPKGDLPWIGKSSRDGHEQALLIFVTPTIIDPVGNRVHTDEQLNSLPNINR